MAKVTQGKIRSSYSHANEISGTSYKLNCYGLINHLIKKTSPTAYAALCKRMENMKSHIPMSYDGLVAPFNFCAIFKSLNEQPVDRWLPVQLLEVKPGDILVYLRINYKPRKTPDLSKPTGTHAMIVQKIIKKEPYSLQLRIIDCSRGPHNKQDTRPPGKSGIGASDLFITYDILQNTYRVSWRVGKKGYRKELIAGRLIIK